MSGDFERSQEASKVVKVTSEEVTQETSGVVTLEETQVTSGVVTLEETQVTSGVVTYGG